MYRLRGSISVPLAFQAASLPTELPRQASDHGQIGVLRKADGKSRLFNVKLITTIYLHAGTQTYESKTGLSGQTCPQSDLTDMSYSYTSRVLRKPVFGVADQVRDKLCCSASEVGKRLDVTKFGLRKERNLPSM